MRRHLLLSGSVVLLALAACRDATTPTDPPVPSLVQGAEFQQRAQWFARAAPEVLALPQTVFADHDESANRLVFGVEHAGVTRGVETVLTRLGIPTSAYRIVVTEPIRFMATLRDEHRPTQGGIQIHFSMFLCTLGFNVDHGGGRSFITNSHCTDKQGETDGTTYFQPASDVNSQAIGNEVDDPAYFKGGECSRGKQCRYSDAARARYDGATESNRGQIAKTTGVNTGSITTNGTFTVSQQDDGNTSFSGTINKVGRTTGWTQGGVTNTCATVNVFGSNIQMLCQTLVQQSGTQIVGGGDSGSPVFQIVSGDNVRLVGILWGGSSSGDLFVFSPLKSIQTELGAMTGTATGDPPPPENQPPTASFTFSCTGLACDFTDTSADSDGLVTAWSWDFGDGNSSTAQHPTHTYSADGTYPVTLTVTDDDDATGQVTQNVAVSSGGGGEIILTASTRANPRWNFVDLSWSGASGANVDLYRNGELITTTANDGSHTDKLDGSQTGSFTYKVCNAGTSNCSNEATVSF